MNSHTQDQNKATKGLSVEVAGHDGRLVERVVDRLEPRPRRLLQLLSALGLEAFVLRRR